MNVVIDTREILSLFLNFQEQALCGIQLPEKFCVC